MCVCVCVVRRKQEPEVGMVYNKKVIIQYTRNEHKNNCKNFDVHKAVHRNIFL